MSISQGGKVPEEILRYSPDMICTINKSGCIEYVNEACKAILGYKKEELAGRCFFDLLHPDERANVGNQVQKLFSDTKTITLERRYLHKTGPEVMLSCTLISPEEEDVFYCIAHDCSGRKKAKETLKKKEARYEALMEHGSDLMSLFDEELNFLYCSGSALRQLGYTPQELEGTSALELIHPEDIPDIRESLSRVLHTKETIKTSDFRVRSAEGTWRWLQTTASNQLENPLVKALVTNSSDVTERVLNKRKLEESEQRFKALFESNPDMVIFESREGEILDVNPAVLTAYNIRKEAIVHHRLSDFLPADTALVCNEQLQRALEGNQVKFKIEINFTDAGRRVLSIAKIPVTVNNEMVGVYTIVKDITTYDNSHQIIRQQAKKLSTIFESITDAFFTLDKEWNLTYCNSEFERLLRIKAIDNVGKKLWEIFPEEAQGVFYRHYRAAAKTGKTIHFEAFLARLHMWLQVKAYPSEEGLSVYFDDITEKVNTKKELEKLSLVASKTTNGVMILDAEGVTEWVNEGFTNLTGYTFSEAVGKRPREILQGAETDPNTVNRIVEKLKEGKPFAEEILNYKKCGEKFWLSLEITPVRNEAGELSRFINIQTDITFRKEAEASQFELTRDLFRQNNDLQQFTYIVSHNLRSPVANAMGLVEMLMTLDKDSAVYQDSLAYLKASVYKLDTVLRDLNTILSIRDSKGTLENEKVKLAHKCREALESLQGPLQKAGGAVYIDIDECLEVSGDKAYLYSVFYNLFSNAIKYRSANRPLKVHIKCYGSTERGTLISFADNGSGFDIERAGENVFRLYKRFHSQAEGRGIGLFLIKTHIEAMGGHIEVSSKVDEGTRFLIYLK